jgi:two-component system, chemotaxis family, chemotaxis protein CheY
LNVFLKNLKASQSQDLVYDLSPFRILIVEDSSFILGILYSCLRQMGVGEVLRASSGKRGQEQILRHNDANSLKNIDLVLMDWLMPDGNGAELLKWIRSHSRDSIRFLPVVVCSAFTDAELVSMSRDLGANEVMVKPVSAEKIAMRMLRIIDDPRPYVQSSGFFGPDRRRKIKKIKNQERRKEKPQIVMESHE